MVSLHVPLTPQTQHLIGARELALLKPEAILVNTARGPVVDEAALVASLRAGHPWAAALDVYEDEPRLSPGLRELSNVVLLPHLGSATFATRGSMAELAARNALAAVLGEPVPHPVNPEVLGSDGRLRAAPRVTVGRRRERTLLFGQRGRVPLAGWRARGQSGGAIVPIGTIGAIGRNGANGRTGANACGIGVWPSSGLPWCCWSSSSRWSCRRARVARTPARGASRGDSGAQQIAVAPGETATVGEVDVVVTALAPVDEPVLPDEVVDAGEPPALGDNQSFYQAFVRVEERRRRARARRSPGVLAGRWRQARRRRRDPLGSARPQPPPRRQHQHDPHLPGPQRTRPRVGLPTGLVRRVGGGQGHAPPGRHVRPGHASRGPTQ